MPEKRSRAKRTARPKDNGAPSPTRRRSLERQLKSAGEAGEALANARVDLVQVIREGIPPRAYVPGAEPWLVRGKRHLMPSPAGMGKSLVALVAQVDIVEAGGTTVNLDVENGADEYARRLQDVLAARDDAAGSLAAACSDRLRYFAWPKLRTNWPPEQWAAANGDADLVVIDSSRLALTMAGLDEDDSGDYARFVNGLLLPLSRAEIATLVLDNTGHEATARARGTKAKDDLNEIVYLLQRGRPFDRNKSGFAKLVRKRERFADLPSELHVPLGDGRYGPVEVADGQDAGEFRPTALMERYSRIVEDDPGINANDLYAQGGGNDTWRKRAVKLLANEGYVERRKEGRQQRHYSLRPFREDEGEGGSEPGRRRTQPPGSESAESGSESGAKRRPQTRPRTRRKAPRKRRS